MTICSVRAVRAPSMLVILSLLIVGTLLTACAGADGDASGRAAASGNALAELERVAGVEAGKPMLVFVYTDG